MIENMSAQKHPSGVIVRRESGLPVYLQLVDQLRYLISANRYRVGEYLPTTRQLAGELGVNFNTVNRAYRQLQRDGLIASTPGKGAVVVRLGRPVDFAGDAPAGTGGAHSGGDEVDAILSAALERTLAAGLTAPEVSERVTGLLANLAQRVPPPTQIELDAGRRWRSEGLAVQLAAVSGFEISPCRIEDRTDEEGRPLHGRGGGRVVVRPQYGAWKPERDEDDHETTLDLSVLPARAGVQAILGLERGVHICALAADAGVARWLLDAATALTAEASGARWEAVANASGYSPAAGEWVIAEAGLPGLDELGERAGHRIIAVEMTFPRSVTGELREAVATASR
jgi:hypothetical protein